MTGVYVLVGFFLLLFVAAVLLTRLVKRGEQTDKSIGDLLREQNEVLDHVEIANEVERSTPVRGAARRVQDRWDRSDRSLRDRQTSDGGLDAGQTGRRDGETDRDSQ